MLTKRNLSVPQATEPRSIAVRRFVLSTISFLHVLPDYLFSPTFSLVETITETPNICGEEQEEGDDIGRRMDAILAGLFRFPLFPCPVRPSFPQQPHLPSAAAPLPRAPLSHRQMRIELQALGRPCRSSFAVLPVAKPGFTTNDKVDSLSG